VRHEKLISLLKQKESKRLEFKKFRDEISATLFETVCAFLNRDGGEIIIGADDDGNIIGIEESRIDRMMNNIVTMSNNPDTLDPPFILDPHKYEIEGKSIIYLNIPESSQVHRFKGTVYDRSSDGDFKIKEPQRIAAISNRKSGFYSEMRLCPNISFRDLDPETFKGMRNRLSGVIKYSGSKRYGGYVRVGYIDLSKMNGQDGTIGGTIGGTMNGTIGGVNEPEKQKIAINDTINDTIKQILRLIESDPAITRDQIADTIKISNPTVSRGINKLKQLGIIERVGSKKTGRWVIINKNFGDK